MKTKSTVKCVLAPKWVTAGTAQSAGAVEYTDCIFAEG